MDAPDLGGSGSGGSGDPPFRFGGGSSGGGGASGSFEAADASGGGLDCHAGGGGFADLDISLDLDDLLVLLLVFIALTSALVASIYVIYMSPTLFAELLVDGALSAGLYKRLKHVEAEHWATGAIRRTWIPACGVLLVFCEVGWGLQEIAPGARSIGGVWRHVRAQ